MNLHQSIAPRRLIGPDVPEKNLSLFKAIKVGRQNPLATLPMAAYREPIWSSRSFFGNILVVSDPTAIKRILLDNVANYPKAPMERDILSAAFGDGLLTSEGEKWRAHRRIMSPAFDMRSLAGYAPAVGERIEALSQAWTAKGSGASIDVSEEMTQLTLEIISRTMFSADAPGLNDMVGDTLHRGQELLAFTVLDVMPVIGPMRVARTMKRIHKTFSELDAAMTKLIASRAGRPADAPRDLLDRLVAARDGETGQGLSGREIRDEIVIIFLAGHETTAVAMTFVWYLVSQHPEVEAKLHDELARVLGGRAPTQADLAALPYTRMVIEEAMRLYPPAPGITGRVALEDDDLGLRKIKKGQQIAILPWVLHRHQTLWDDPLRFDPERFAPERSASRPRFAYLPFSGGPRICIGAQLAMMEATLILATLAQRFGLRLAPGPEVELQSRVTLRPKDGMKMVLESRTI
jgi:cytochrome P450